MATCVNVQYSEPAAGSSAISEHCGLGAVNTSGCVTTHTVVTCTRVGRQGASRHILLSRAHGVADRVRHDTCCRHVHTGCQTGCVTTHAIVTCTRGGRQGASRHMLSRAHGVADRVRHDTCCGCTRSHGVADCPACVALTPTWLEMVMLNSTTQKDTVRHRFWSEFKPQRLPVKSGHTNIALEQQRDEKGN